MELRHLRYFVAVAEELHFGRAAKRLHIAQPPLSQQIRALETEIGVTLFDRDQRSVELTAAGKLFLQEAYKTLAQAEQAVLVAQRASRGEIGRLRIGFVSSVAYGILPDIIRTFRERYPSVALELHELASLSQLESIHAGTVDLGFYRLDEEHLNNDRTQGLELEPVLREPFVVAVPDRSPLAAKAAIALGDLRDEDFVLFPRQSNPGLHDFILRHCRQAGFEPRIVQEANLMQTLVSLVAAGLGVTLTPASLQNLQRAGVVYRPVQGESIETQLLAVWRGRDTSPALRAFREAVHEVARKGLAGEPTGRTIDTFKVSD